jgi:hypothetical protein
VKQSGSILGARKIVRPILAASSWFAAAEKSPTHFWQLPIRRAREKIVRPIFLAASALAASSWFAAAGKKSDAFLAASDSPHARKNSPTYFSGGFRFVSSPRPSSLRPSSPRPSSPRPSLLVPFVFIPLLLVPSPHFHHDVDARRVRRVAPNKKGRPFESSLHLL